MSAAAASVRRAFRGAKRGIMGVMTGAVGRPAQSECEPARACTGEHLSASGLLLSGHSKRAAEHNPSNATC